MPLIARILIALASLLVSLTASTTAASHPSNTTASTTLFKRASVGYTERGVPASVYGTDFAFQNGRFVGDLPPGPAMSIGKCGPAFVPSNPSFFVAMNARAFDTAGCGLCARVSSQGRTTVGPIVDVCASCGDGIKVSLAMLGELAGGQDAARRRGVIRVDFEVVPCPSGRGVGGSLPSSGSNGGNASTNNRQQQQNRESKGSGQAGKGSGQAGKDPNAGNGSSGRCSRFGFPCCQKQQGRSSAARDKNGVLYGFENGRSCVFV